jgi:hypothetical protein
MQVHKVFCTPGTTKNRRVKMISSSIRRSKQYAWNFAPRFHPRRCICSGEQSIRVYANGGEVSLPADATTFNVTMPNLK